MRGACPRPSAAYISHIFCGGIASAIFAVPTFDDFCTTCSTVSGPYACASPMVLVPIVRRPGAVWITVPGLTSPMLEGHRDGERLHRRAGLEGVGDDAVAQLRAGQLTALVRVVGRPVGQRQDLAGVRVEHHRRARLRLVALHRVAQCVEGEKLDLAVDRQRQVVAVVRLAHRPDILDHPPEPVADHPAAARAPGQFRVAREFDAFLADVLDVGEADHVRERLALRGSSACTRAAGGCPESAVRRRARRPRRRPGA